MDDARRARAYPRSCGCFRNGAAAEHAGQPCSVEHELCSLERGRRLGAFVRVHAVVAETVAAAAGCEVIQGQAEPVAAEEPFECALSAGPVLGLARDRERRELRFDERGRIEWLLVAVTRSGLVTLASAIA